MNEPTPTKEKRDHSRDHAAGARQDQARDHSRDQVG